MKQHNDSDCAEGSACAIDFSKEEESSPKIHIDKAYLLPFLGICCLLVGIGLDYWDVPSFKSEAALLWFGVIYLVIGGPIVLKALKRIAEGDIYNEFVLMSVATIGAFLLGSYAEGVAVMLFYVVGELLQGSAVHNAKKSIEALLKVQVEEVTVLHDGQMQVQHPKNVELNQIISVKPGEKVALDGQLRSESAYFNTAALTGESKPQNIVRGEEVLAGMINMNRAVEIQVTRPFEDTKLSQILTLVQEAVGRKAKTQLLISRLAKVYTPIVFWLAIALVAVPFFMLGEDYVFQMWFRRALIFLVISCPCALVISIPLGYFGGIGAGSKNGILFKGANYLDLLTKVDTVIMDKTGTLTKGVFEVQQVETVGEIDPQRFLAMVGALEQHSTHPIARAIVEYTRNTSSVPAMRMEEVEEISGHGMTGKVDEVKVLAGNAKLLEKYGIALDKSLDARTDTMVYVAINGRYAGYIAIADTLKEDAREAIEALHNIKRIKEIVMLSGDKPSVVHHIAQALHIDKAIGGLLPANKISEVEKQAAEGRTIAFVGDGINDAPAIALADVGIAMGGLGADAAVETADVIIQTDHPSKIATAIRIGNETNKIIWQNITLALGIKILVLLLGAFGMATMWEAVIADVGVALLAILNAVRIQKMKF